MIAPEVLDALLAHGATAEMIVAAVKADNAIAEQAVDERRAKDAERQRRHRLSRDVTVTNGDSVTSPSPQSPPLKVSPDPFKNTPPLTPQPTTKLVRAWACPIGVDPTHWADFRKNRRTKRLTDSETAYSGQLKALETLSDDEWPPGRLVQFAAEKGWGSINDPRTTMNGTANGQSGQRNSLRGTRPDPALDLYRSAVEAEHREKHEADSRARAALPSYGPS